MTRLLCFGRVARAAAVVALAAVLAACVADEIVVLDEDPRLFIHSFDWDDYLVPDHTIGGNLRYNIDTECMYLNDRGAKLVIWPAGVTPLFEGDERGVDFPEHGAIMQGDDIRVSYLFVPEEEFRSLDGWEAIESCLPRSGEIVFVHQVHG